ncbi:hypothetical protein MesoLj131b_07790 [Mesorhizobium sp. 131-2-5]|uniref:hypothetical protein n=1 Tax=Mesorhizobium sp. 131-2-5 TaxID=2744519 RepID=UPI001925C127|nr:hypothetical protein [Mesorhizobium sp. 131-2-5]BCG98779.1 hypothetical protein MesoLj131b_07790 [Mesorhizobium sp. 131-2-5]
MEARGITNLLLAVIAGVLLFGREAMVGGFWWVVVLGIGIGVLFAVLMFVSYLFREVAKAYREANTWYEAGAVTMGFVFMVVLVPLMGYAGLLWLDGVPKPMDAAMKSPIGTVWMYVLVGGIGILALVAVSDGVQWLTLNRSDVPGILSHRLRVIMWGYLEFLGGPVTFPIRDLRIRREAGAGTAVKVMSAAFGSVIGLVVSLMTILLTVGAVVGLLSLVGLISI